MELNENKDKLESYRERARELVAKLTPEAKVEQMVFRAPAIPELNIKAYNWWNEALHGVARAGTATVFPQAIGMAAAFDEELLEEVADAIATEARAKFNVQQAYGDTDIYKGLTFWAPNVNIFRDPRWGRGHETYGEDPYLTSRLGVRFIKGLQGHDENYLKTAACAKHFAVHSGPEQMRHHFDARVSEKDLRETYLPAFKACVEEAKVEAVMGAYNRTNGEPCCGNKRLLTDILRGEWGFDGHVVSDCWAIQDFHMHHKVTAGPKESAATAVRNGCDLNCGEMFYHLIGALKEGLITEAEIDEALTRLFMTRMKLGMLEEHNKTAAGNGAGIDAPKNPFADISYLEVDSPRMRTLNRRVAREGLVLLSNKEHTLPLHKQALRTVGVVGPNANNRRALVGNYEGTAARYVTVLEGIQEYLGEEVRVLYSEACHLYLDRSSNLTEENDRFSELKAVIAESDVIIACMGLDAGLEGEEGDTGNAYASGDKADLRLPGKQPEVLQMLADCGKPVVLLLLSGSALMLDGLENKFAVIMQCFYPGAEGGMAIAEVLFGDYSPCGKLPVTFYHSTEELPDFTDYAMKGRTYRYMQTEALYPFGYGLSYADIRLSFVSRDESGTDSQDSAKEKHTMQQKSMTCKELQTKGLSFSCRVRNESSFPASEVLQVYVGAEAVDMADDIPHPQLKWFQKISLAAGEEREINVTMTSESFLLCDANGEFKLYPGRYAVYAGFSQPDSRSIALTGKEPLCLQMEIN